MKLLILPDELSV